MTKSIESEYGVLSCILRGVIQPDETGLEPEHFADESARQIFRKFSKMQSEAFAIDLITATDYLGDEYAEELLGIAEGGAGLNEQMGIDYAQIVLDKWRRRQIEYIAADVWQNASVWTVEQSVSALEAAGDVFSTNLGQQSPNPKEMFREAVRAVDERIRNGGQLSGVTSGFQEIDIMTNGWQKGDLIILGARPSMGKTALSINFMNNAIKKNAKVVYFSIEMPREKMVMRMLAAEGRVPLDALKTGREMDEHFPKMTVAINNLRDKQFAIDDRSYMTPSLMRAALRGYKKTLGGIDLIIVDYLQLMNAGKSTESETQKVSEISKQLKAIAKDFDCPLIALAQLNRGLETRPNKRPTNSDLRQSGQIEQDADVIMFLYRDQVYHPDTEFPNTAEVIFSKQRDGEIGMKGLSWDGSTQRFMDLTWRPEQ
jgi:replicative DNA helicase